MKLATNEELKVLKRGTPVLVNVNDDVSDIGLFLGYNEFRQKALVLDCYSKGIDSRYHANICEYDEVFLLELTEDSLATLAHLSSN